MRFTTVSSLFSCYVLFTVLSTRTARSETKNLWKSRGLGDFNSEDPQVLVESFFRAMKEELTTSKNDGIKLNFIMNNLLNIFLSSAFPTAVAKNISKQCQEDSIKYVKDLANFSNYALQMRESSGKLPPGLFGSLNIHADGLFDECIEVVASDDGFHGQYCSVFFSKVPINNSETPLSELTPPSDTPDERLNLMTIFQILGFLSESMGNIRLEPLVSQADQFTSSLPSISICLPSSCSADDLGRAVAQVVGGYPIQNSTVLTITDESYCFTKAASSEHAYDAPDIVVIVLLSLIAVTVILATVFDYWRLYHRGAPKNKTENIGHKVLLSFSAISNAKKIMSVEKTDSPDQFTCLYGIRVLSMVWIVFSHSYALGPTRTAMNRKQVYQDSLTWPFQIIGNGSFSVDTFFVISGMLVSYFLLKHLDKSKGRFNPGFFYLHRYIRLTIAYAFVLAFIATLMVHVGTGPNWYTVKLVSEACEVKWWQNLLYINNMFPSVSVMCMGHSWYLAVDTQLFLIAPLIIYPLWRWKRSGVALFVAIFLVVHAVVFAVFAVNDFTMPSLIFTRLRDMGKSAGDYNDLYYVKPWTRAPAYLVGIALGWVMYRTKDVLPNKNLMPKWAIVSSWVATLAVIPALIFGLSAYTDPSEVPEIGRAIVILYGALSRTVWAVAIGWIIFACIRGYGGIINEFLSWDGFKPLGRITFCAYLVHYDYINVFDCWQRKLVYYTFWDQITATFGMLAIIFGLGMLVSVTVEAPFLNLEKLLFQRDPNKEAKGDSTSKDAE